MAKGKGRAHLFEEPEKAAKDYDPEADVDVDSNSGSDASEDANAGTEDYETVGKSKLRQKENVSLGPAYRGSKVSRAALDQESDEDDEDEDDEEDEEDYADPDLIDLEADEAEASDSEIDSDNALGESDAEHFEGYTFRGSSKPAKAKAKRATAADFLSSSSDEEGEPNGADASDDEDEDEDEDMDDGLEELVNGGGTSDEDEDEDAEGSDEEESDSDDEAPKKAAGPKLQTMSGHSNPDVQKGLAIQQQRKVYDGLLNLRIRLQKALVASNTFPTVEDASEAESEPYEAAEEAAVKLLNTISSLKGTFGPAGGAGGAGSKRKRDVEKSMTAAQMWECLQEEDKRPSKARKANLEKWSQKVRAVNDASSKKSLVSSLEQQIDDTEYRLVKRTKVPRSCAPAQAAKRVTEDADIFDDADFYQQLLKELVDQRTVDSSIDQASTVPSVMLTAARDVKTRKVVDRKASKGRKMRFTVHEKLQNFMAPEDRRVWEQGAIDRFFGTLFGQRLELNEEDVQSDEDEDLGGLTAEAEGLRLFK